MPVPKKVPGSNLTRREAEGGPFEVQQATVMRINYRLNMELDHQSLFGLHVVPNS
jgi:hypothetical protein